jgi:hypothetical protein
MSGKEVQPRKQTERALRLAAAASGMQGQGGTVPVEQLALAHRSLRAPLDTNSKEGLFCAESALMAVMVMVGRRTRTDRWLARRAIDKRGLAAWDADWLAAGLRWTPGRRARVVMTKVPGQCGRSAMTAGAVMAEESEASDKAGP